MGEIRRGLKRALVVGLAFLIAASTVGAIAPEPAQAATEMATISGTVRIPADAPAGWLGAVHVFASRASGAGGSAIVDPITGRYTITGLAPADYRVQFSAFSSADPMTGQLTPVNLVTEYYDDVTDYNGATVVTARSDAPATGIDADLEYGSTITGTISIPDDAPADWMNAVNVYASSDSGAGSGGSATVDRATGEYTITGLSAGAYRVQFSASTYWDPDTEQPVSVNLVAEYYDGADYGGAALVTTAPEAPATGVDAALEYGGTISGRITIPDDAPAEWRKHLSVSASRTTGSSFGGSATIDAATGRYTITGLSAGDYHVRYSAVTYGGSPGGAMDPVNLVAEYYDDAPDAGSATAVTIASGATVTGVDVDLDYGSIITGTVSLPREAPAEWRDAVSVSVSRTDATWSGGSSSIDRETGRYIIAGLPAGGYRVQFSAYSYWDAATGQSMPVNLVPEYYENAVDPDGATIVTVDPESPATGVDARLASGATIRGTLRDPAGAPVAGAEVWVVDAADASRVLTASASTDASGSYSLTRIPAGSYKLLIANLHDEPPVFRRTFLGAPTFATATKIKVAAGATITGQDAVLEAPAAGAKPPSPPVLTAGERVAGFTTVAWNLPASADPIVAFSVSSMGGWWGDGGPVSGPKGTSGRAWVGESSTLVLVSAWTGSAASAGALAVNDAESPAAPVLRAATTTSAVTVTVDSAVPADAEWWFGFLADGEGAGNLRVEYPDALVRGAFTFANVDTTSGFRVFAGWRSGTTTSQIATLTRTPNAPPAGPTVNPWFQAKYAEQGGVSGPLGAPLKNMECQSSSCWQEFAGGVLTSDGREIVVLSTAYVRTWLANGGPDGELGLVAGPEACFGTYCVAPFTHGVIKWTPNVGVKAILVHSWFEAKWKALGGVTGSIGSPVEGMRCQSSSCWQEFTGGVLTSDGRQIVKLSTAYVSTWLAWGGPDGDLGLVGGPESCFGNYCQTSFAGGVIIWVPNSGVFPVAQRWFYPDWVARGGASGSLGLPTDAMRCQSSACYQVFRNGTLTSSTSGIVALSSAYVSTWLAGGGPDGALGLVSGSEACFGTYCQVPFQHGGMVWQPGSGVRILIGGDWATWQASHAAPDPVPPTSPGVGTPANPGDTKNCTDFATHAQAQAWFDLYYPHYGDVARLDRDNDGLACVDLP